MSNVTPVANGTQFDPLAFAASEFGSCLGDSAVGKPPVRHEWQPGVRTETGQPAQVISANSEKARKLETLLRTHGSTPPYRDDFSAKVGTQTPRWSAELAVEDAVLRKLFWDTSKRDSLRGGFDTIGDRLEAEIRLDAWTQDRLRGQRISQKYSYCVLEKWIRPIDRDRDGEEGDYRSPFLPRRQAEKIKKFLDERHIEAEIVGDEQHGWNVTLSPQNLRTFVEQLQAEDAKHASEGASRTHQNRIAAGANAARSERAGGGIRRG